MNNHDLSYSEVAEKQRVEAYLKAQREHGEDGVINKAILTILLIIAMGSPWLVLFLMYGGTK